MHHELSVKLVCIVYRGCIQLVSTGEWVRSSGPTKHSFVEIWS